MYPHSCLPSSERIRFLKVLAGDLANAVTMKAALTRTDVLLLVTSGPDLDRQDEAVALYAKAAGVARLVKLSSYVVREKIGTGGWHAQGEAANRGRGIGYTLVQPSGFMSNALFWARSIKAEGVVRTATGDGKIPFFHPRDIADVTAQVLLSDTYRGTSLPVAGPEALAYTEMGQRSGL